MKVGDSVKFKKPVMDDRKYTITDIFEDIEPADDDYDRQPFASGWYEIEVPEPSRAILVELRLGDSVLIEKITAIELA